MAGALWHLTSQRSRYVWYTYIYCTCTTPYSGADSLKGVIILYSLLLRPYKNSLMGVILHSNLVSLKQIIIILHSLLLGPLIKDSLKGVILHSNLVSLKQIIIILHSLLLGPLHGKRLSEGIHSSSLKKILLS